MFPDLAPIPEYQPLLDGSQSYDDQEWISALQDAGGAGATIPERVGSERYLRRHWIVLTDLRNDWLPVVDAVFRPLPPDARQVDDWPVPAGPEVGFPPDWTVLAWDAGAPLSEETYAALQDVMTAAGDESWMLLERPHYGGWPDATSIETSPVPLHRLRFRARSTWAEVNGDREDLRDPLQAATSVSGDLFTVGREEYLLVGDTGAWGLSYRGGAMRGQCVLGVGPCVEAVAHQCFAEVLAEHGAPEVLHVGERRRA